jgi:hypothetical protein
MSSQEDRTQEYTLYLPISDEDTPLEAGERLVLRWDDETQKRGRAIVEEINNDKESASGHDLSWHTFKISVQIQDHVSNLRHYPRLLSGFEFFYASLHEIDEGEDWLTNTTTLDLHRLDIRFSRPIDELINFSVSGLSFESNEPIDNSSPLLCAIGVDRSKALIRCLSKVVRCEREGDHYCVAIHFISPPVELAETLSDVTLRLQRKETEGELHEI